MNWRNANEAGTWDRCGLHGCLRAEGHAGQCRRPAGLQVLLGPGRCEGCGHRVVWARMGGRGGPAWRNPSGGRHRCAV